MEEDGTIMTQVRFWDLSGSERETLLFLKRVCRTRSKLAVYWEDDLNTEITLVGERHVRQRELFRKGLLSFDPDADPPLLVTEDGQLAFLAALSSLREKGCVWEKLVLDCEGVHVLYKPLI